MERVGWWCKGSWNCEICTKKAPENLQNWGTAQHHPCRVLATSGSPVSSELTLVKFKMTLQHLAGSGPGKSGSSEVSGVDL